MEAQPSPLSSRAKPRDLQFRGPLSELFFVDPRMMCHPDRSVAKWRDLLFILHSIESEWKRDPPLCRPERSRGICSAPLVPPECSLSNLNPQTEVSSQPERSEVEGPAVHHPQERIRMEAQPSPLSSRAKPRDLRCAPRPFRILRIRNLSPQTAVSSRPERSAVEGPAVYHPHHRI